MLIGLVKVINQPLTYIVKTAPEISQKLVETALDNNDKLDSESSSLELAVVNDIKNEKNIEKYLEVLEKKKRLKKLKI